MHQDTECAINVDASATLTGGITKTTVHSIQLQLKAEAHLPKKPRLALCGGL